MCFSCFTGLFWYCEESHWLVYHQAQAGYGSIPGAVAVCGRCVAHVQQCLVVQPQNIPRLQVLHQVGRSVWSRDRSRHAGLGLLLRQEGETQRDGNLTPNSAYYVHLVLSHYLYLNVDADVSATCLQQWHEGQRSLLCVHSMSSHPRRCVAMANSCVPFPGTAPTTATRTGKSVMLLWSHSSQQR